MSFTPVTGTSLQPLPIRTPAVPAATATAQTQAPSAATPASAEPVPQEALNLQTPAQAGSAAQSVGFIDAATAHDPASPAELRWAKNLEQRVEQGYQPTPEEIELYQEIYQKVQTAPPAPQPDPIDSTETGVSQQELQWALDLEEKVKMGYQPTQQEIKAYQDIAVRVAHGPIEGKPLDLPPEVSQEDIDWALQLEKSVLQGYVPTENEIIRYQSIAERLTHSGSVETPAPTPIEESTSVSQQELHWARELMKHVESGYQPTQQEAARYNEIYSRLQATQHQQVNQAELDWAQQLQSKVEQGYQPSAAEVKQYEKIYQRYQEQNQVKPPLHQAPLAVPAIDSTAPVQDSSAVQEQAPAPVLPKSSAAALNFGVGRWTRQV